MTHAQVSQPRPRIVAGLGVLLACWLLAFCCFVAGLIGLLGDRDRESSQSMSLLERWWTPGLMLCALAALLAGPPAAAAVGRHAGFLAAYLVPSALLAAVAILT